MKIINTARLRLSPLKAKHFACYYRLYSDPEVMAFIGPVWDEKRAREEFEPYLAPWLDLENQWLSFAISEQANGTELGIIGLRNESQYCKRRELGFMLLPQAQGFGYAKEAGQAMLQLAFNELGSHKVTATADGENLASQNVLSSLGFQREGILREQFFLAGQWRDDHVFSILKEDYTQVTWVYSQ